jgi:uncharacterized membrane protein YfcA
MTPSILTLIAAFLVMVLAGLTQGLTGFGYALVSVPLLIIFLSPKVVVPVVVLHCVLCNALVLLEVWRWADLKRIWPLMLAATIGTPLGTYLLVVLDVNALKVLMGLVIALFGLAFLVGFRKEIRNERLACGPLGLVSGLLSGSTGMAGPPIVLFFANQGMDKQSFRANLVAYFLVLNLVTIPGHLLGGLVSETVVLYTLLLLPGLVLGTVAGIRLAGRVDEKRFRTVSLLVVTAAGLVSLASGLQLL